MPRAEVANPEGVERPNEAGEPAPAPAAAARPSLPELISKGSEPPIHARLKEGVDAFAGELAGKYCMLSLYDPRDQIGEYEASQIFSALKANNPKRDKDVLLMLASPGGRIEPAYQISKVCKAFARENFVVVIPRAAKSAATLIALGADTIHMGMLGELGPIDPQIEGKPALAVKRALETIASLCEQYPGSAGFFAQYAARALKIEQIGYAERVGESAVQYAERLLGKKLAIKPQARRIAQKLVNEYKDHSFVIDFEEAKAQLGDSWIVNDSPELDFAERVYEMFNETEILMSIFHKKRLYVVGGSRTRGSSTGDRKRFAGLLTGVLGEDVLDVARVPGDVPGPRAEPAVSDAAGRDSPRRSRWK
jgi:hypothetical protein